jgi:hypothetical protein
MAFFESLLGLVGPILDTFWRRGDKEVERQDKQVEVERLVGIELENLADLMSAVLSATDTQGRIVESQLGDLNRLRKRSWNRWVEILGSGAYGSLSEEDSNEIEKLIRISHAAPGSYVDEVYLIQIAVEEGSVPYEVRRRFADSVDRIRDKGVQLRLRA